MIRLYVDGVELPLLSSTDVMPRYSIAMLRDIESWRSGEDVEVEVAATPAVDAIMLHAADLHRGASFNDTAHVARVTVDDITVFEGQAILVATTSDGATHGYKLRLRRGGAEWAKIAALTPFSEGKIDCNMSYSIYDIERSWSDDSAVRFLPIQRDSYPALEAPDFYIVEKILMPHEYHPFISVDAIVQDVIRRGGYNLRSNFLQSSIFKRLMMSGAYRTVDTAAAEMAMGFKACRSFTSTATASPSGIVNVCEPQIAYNIGVIADTTDSNATDEDGNRLNGAHDNGPSISYLNGNMVFTPKREIGVSFEYFIHYTTQCRMASSSHLQGFTRIFLGNDCEVNVILPNPYLDRRNEVYPNTQYKLVVFDHEEGNSYMLNGMTAVSGDECIVKSTNTDAIIRTRLYVRRADETEYSIFTGDWALYDGHVERDTTREVSLTVRTPYEVITPTAPKAFKQIQFRGAIEGQQLTLHSGCSVKAIFGGVAGYGDTLTFKDIAHHNIQQIEVLSAVAHMFNLCLYSHDASKTLYVEPYDSFFSGDIVDWRERQRGHNWRYDEALPQLFERVRLAYAGSDGVVTRLTEGDDKQAGWTFAATGYGSKMGTDSRINPMFYPTASTMNVASMAPSAEILTIGDRDTIATNDYVEPRIVLYHGLRELPEQERWQAYNDTALYPFASFHSPNADATLDFSDRDNLVGLHSYYDRELRECSERGELICSIEMRVDEYLALLDPMTEGANIRSRFRLSTEYGSSLFILVGIEKYDAESHQATCRFRRMLTD